MSFDYKNGKLLLIKSNIITKLANKATIFFKTLLLQAFAWDRNAYCIRYLYDKRLSLKYHHEDNCLMQAISNYIDNLIGYTSFLTNIYFCYLLNMEYFTVF